MRNGILDRRHVRAQEARRAPATADTGTLVLLPATDHLADSLVAA